MSDTILEDDYAIPVSPKLAKAVGLNEAIILQQVHYWLKKYKDASEHQHDGRCWVYNSYDEWTEQFPFWCKRTVRTTINKLENDGLLIVGNFNRFKYDHTRWYTIDYDKLKALVNSDVANSATSNRQDLPQPSGNICQHDTIDYPKTSFTIDYQLEDSCRQEFSDENACTSTSDVDDKVSMTIVHKQIEIVCKDKNLSQYANDIYDIFEYFYKKHKRFTGKDHVRLSQENIAKVLDKFEMATYDGIGDYESNSFYVMIDDYFNPNYNYDKNCNYSILHFSEYNILQNCYYRTIY